MRAQEPPLPAAVLAVCGWSGSGKTTLLETAIPILVRRGLRVAMVKHCGHGAELDRPGKDSDRLFRAGANVVVRTPHETAHRIQEPDREDVTRVVRGLAQQHDLVLIEGYKSLPFVKVWLEHPRDPRSPAGLDHLRAVLPCVSNREELLLELIERELWTQWRGRPVYAGVLAQADDGGDSESGGGAARERRSRLGGLLAALAPNAGRVFLLGDACSAQDPAMDRLPDAPGAGRVWGGLLSAVRWAPRACWIFVRRPSPPARSEIEWLLGQRAPGRWAILPQDGIGRGAFAMVCEPQGAAMIEELARQPDSSPHDLVGRPFVWSLASSAGVARGLAKARLLEAQTDDT